MMPLIVADMGTPQIIKKVGGNPGESGLCGRRTRDRSQLYGRQSDRQCQGIQNRHQSRDGTENHDLTSERRRNYENTA